MSYNTRINNVGRQVLLNWATSSFLAVSFFATPSYSQPATVYQLKADLLAGDSATQVLTRWCAARAMSASAVIHAIRDLSADATPPSDARTLLQASAGDVIAYRRVRLMCGDHIFSEADNWYIPARLTPKMNKSLDQTDTSFGTVVKPLNFHRRTLKASTQSAGLTILRVRALLLTPDDLPFSLVVENYTSDMTGTAR